MCKVSSLFLACCLLWLGACGGLGKAPSCPNGNCSGGCGDGNYRSGGSCVASTDCPAGLFVAQDVTETTDRVCAACPSGSFASGTNSATCTAWKTCEAGTYVSSDPSARADRACTTCAPGSRTTGANQSLCVADKGCPAGTKQTLPGSATTDPVCVACAAGDYCAGGASEPVPCSGDSFDNDGSPATACVPKSACGMGTYVAQAGNSTSDRVCAPCTGGTFNLSANALTCRAWSTCGSGTFVVNVPSNVTDRVCAACAAGTFTSLENQSSCLAAKDCAAGTAQTAAATSTSAAVCAACHAGQYCAGGRAPAVTCASDMWDHDGNPATACIAKVTCAAGSSMSDAGSATTDRSCLPCASGGFTTTSNAAACSTWTDCPAGTYVFLPGTTMSDRRCETCAVGTFTNRPNLTSCTDSPKCPAGTIQTGAATSTSPVTCKSCQSGQYCAGDLAPAVPCSEDTWDKDGNPATACVPKSVCPAGTSVVQSGSPTTDRTCIACGSGTFSTTTNVPACTTWKTCAPGSYMTNTPSTTLDRTCADCPADTFSSQANQSECIPVGQCDAGTQETAPGTSTSPPTCAACIAGQYCPGGSTAAVTCASGTWDDDANPATACVDWTECSAGTFVSTAGSPTADQACTTCPSGTFTVASNQSSCTSCAYFSDDFSTSAKGWSSTGGGWEIGPAVAWWGGGYVGSPDPTTDHSPSSDNGIAGVVIGSTEPTTITATPNYFTSPVVDLSTVSTPITLSFYRWLNSDYPPFMTNSVEVFNGTGWVTLWSGPATSTVIQESSWNYWSFDVTAYRSANFQVRFGYQVMSGGVYPVGSWNLDDVSVAYGSCAY